MKRPKRMLFELPVADEIDELATRTPRFEVRKFELDLEGQKADLNYAPCKGQLVLVARGEKGTALVKREGSHHWELPSARIPTYEKVEQAAKQLARSQCGIGVRGLELVGMYDVVWHYSDISIKRLHLIYVAIAEDTECKPAKDSSVKEAAFFADLPESVYKNELYAAAIEDTTQR